MQKKQALIPIRRIRTVRYIGIASAAAALGVTRQAVSNYVTGNAKRSLSAEKAARIQIINSKG